MSRNLDLQKLSVCTTLKWLVFGNSYFVITSVGVSQRFPSWCMTCLASEIPLSRSDPLYFMWLAFSGRSGCPPRGMNLDKRKGRPIIFRTSLQATMVSLSVIDFFTYVGRLERFVWSMEANYHGIANLASKSQLEKEFPCSSQSSTWRTRHAIL